MWNNFILTSIDYPATDLENIPSDRWWLVFLQISGRDHSIRLSTVQWVGGEPELSIFSPRVKEDGVRKMQRCPCPPPKNLSQISH